jgi:hypothetical protein
LVQDKLLSIGTSDGDGLTLFSGGEAELGEAEFIYSWCSATNAALNELNLVLPQLLLSCFVWIVVS